MRRALGFLFLVLLVGLWGCGGSSSGGSTRTGKVGFTVKWPTQGRLIPYDCGVIVATLTDANQQVIGSPQTVNRPTQGVTSTTVTFNNVPTGVVTLSAVAYPAGYPNGAGTTVAQASGTQQGTVVSGQTTPITVTMADTIVGITILNAASGSPGGTLATNATQQLAFNAYDSSNETVMVSPNTISWSIPVGSQYGNVSSTGLVTMLASGSTSQSFQVEVTETESGKVSQPVTFDYVAASSTTLQHPYQAVIDPSGKHLYTTVSTGAQGGIHVFNISGSTGQLSFVQEIFAPGVNVLDSIYNKGLVITPDGTQLFVYGDDSDTIDQYKIQSDGTLVSEGQVSAPGAVESLCIDPSGQYLYAGGIASGVALFQYTITSSGLSYDSALTNFNPGVPVNLARVGNTNYLIGAAANGSGGHYLLTFTVNPDGSLQEVAQTDVSAQPYPGAPYLSTPDGSQFYSLEQQIQIFGVASNGITTFDETFQGISSTTDAPQGVISPNGEFMFFRPYGGQGYDQNGVIIYSLNILTGTLSQASYVNGLPAEVAGSVVVTPDGKFVYTTNTYDNSISEFTTNSFGTLTALSPGKVTD